MEKGMRTVLVALIIFSLVCLTSGIKFFLAEREAFAKYMRAKETLEQARATWEEELARAEEERGKLRSRLDAVARRRSELEAENRALMEAKDNLALQRDNLALQRGNLTTQVVDLEKKIGTMASELYFADLLKEKAILEVEAENLKEALKSREAELEKIVRTSDGLKSKLARLKTESQVAETLSRDLAKTKRDKYMAIEALGRLEAENRELQERFAQLAGTEASLEERLVVASERLWKAEEERDRLTEDIEGLRARLAKTKEERERGTRRKDASIELPPIVVKAELAPGGKEPSVSPQGRIVTVNNEYRFVVIDLGKEDGVKVGMPCIVYRGDEEIGQLEIIEAHQKVSAADVKKVKKRMSIEVDDVVVPAR